MCKNANETVNHLFLGCHVVSSLWTRLFQVTGTTWVNYTSCGEMLGARLNFFGGKRKGMVLGYCAIMAVFWVVWGERNRTFENKLGNDSAQLWDRIRHWASLWASTSSEFSGINFQHFHLDWNAVVL